jgi:hypothetical protein
MGERTSYVVQVLPDGCFVAERRRRGRAVYGCGVTYERAYQAKGVLHVAGERGGTSKQEREVREIVAAVNRACTLEHAYWPVPINEMRAAVNHVHALVHKYGVLPQLRRFNADLVVRGKLRKATRPVPRVSERAERLEAKIKSDEKALGLTECLKRSHA